MSYTVCCEEGSLLCQELSEVRSLNTFSDIATLLDVYQEYINQGGKWYEVTGFLEDSQHYYYLRTASGNMGDFDFYKIIKSLWQGREDISCINALNARYLVGQGRGLGTGTVDTSSFEDSSTSDMSDDLDATGIMSESDIVGIAGYNVCILQNEITGQEFSVYDGDSLIGRSNTCDIVLSSNKVSRQHCKITRNNLNYFIQDLNSANGVYLNKRRILSGDQTMLSDGDKLSIADQSFNIVLR